MVWKSPYEPVGGRPSDAFPVLSPRKRDGRLIVLR